MDLGRLVPIFFLLRSCFLFCRGVFITVWSVAHGMKWTTTVYVRSTIGMGYVDL